MKKILLYSYLLSTLLFSLDVAAQSQQQKLNEEMEKAMKNMTPQQREQMKKIMPAIMPRMMEEANDYRYPDFSNNGQLLYKKDMARINAIPKKIFTQADIPLYVNTLFTKIMTKGDVAEIALIKSVTAKGSSAAHFGNAAILCMLQGHAQAAMGLSMKAVQADPSGPNWQNNMAALLTQYGYAEQAIPVLQKLKNEWPGNSTVYNNLAQAWFTLGVLDSAKTYTMMAGKLNPDNPDAKVCGGVVDEAEGNTASAIEKYKEAMAQSPSPFTESLLKNSKGSAGINDIDFDKLIHNITVYDYFPKDWIQIPELSNNVSNFEKDIAIKNGYAKMFIRFFGDLQTKINISEADIKNLTRQGHEEFAIDMITAGAKHGNSFITTPARIIISLITIKLQKLSTEYEEVRKEIKDHVDRIRQGKNNGSEKDNCETTDRRNNKFLAEANSPAVNRHVFEKYIETYRRWLNAYCTWTWYLSGNIRNVSMAQCLNFTKFYAGLYRDAIEMQQTAFPCGKEGIRSDGETKPNTPLIPNFFCPAVVSVPAGPDWQALDDKLKNFDANSLGIKKLSGAPVPNTNIMYGATTKQIAQSGKSPAVGYSYGFVVPQYQAGGYDLARLLTLDQINRMYGKYLQNLLESMMVSPCDDLQKLTPEQKKKFWEEKKIKAAKEAKQKAIKELDEEINKNADEQTIKRLNEEIQRMYEEMSGNKFFPIPTLSSSIQPPGTFTPQQNLFK